MLRLNLSGCHVDCVQWDEVDKVLVAIWVLEADVNNGGLDQYHFNSAGDFAFYAEQALQSIGAHAMARIVARANSLFGPDGPPRDRNFAAGQRTWTMGRDGPGIQRVSR